jgi:hypothetical protein
MSRGAGVDATVDWRMNCVPKRTATCRTGVVGLLVTVLLSLTPDGQASSLVTVWDTDLSTWIPTIPVSGQTPVSESCLELIRLEECYEPLKSASFNVINEDIIVPDFNNDTLDVLCQHLTAAKLCAGNTTQSPNDTVCYIDNSVRQGQEMALEFICGTGNELYFKYRDCFLSSSVRVNGFDCYSTFRKQLADLETSRMSLADKKQALCSHMDALVTCVSDVTNKSCGIEAAEWMMTYKTLLTKPAKWEIARPANSSRRPFDDSLTRTPVLFYIIVICLLVVASTSLILFLCTRRHRHLADVVVVSGRPRGPQPSASTSAKLAVGRQRSPRSSVATGGGVVGVGGVCSRMDRVGDSCCRINVDGKSLLLQLSSPDTPLFVTSSAAEQVLEDQQPLQAGDDGAVADPGFIV